jgi:sugar phosphate isomerase/epimerase
MKAFAVVMAALAAVVVAPLTLRADTPAEPAAAPPIAEQADTFREIPRALRARLGVQLYSYRHDLKRDLDGTLTKLRALGFRNVETYVGATETAAQLRAALDKAGLKAVAAHMPYDMVRTDPQGTVDYVKTLGAREIGIAWVQTAEPFDETQARAAIAAFNTACPILRAAGLTPYYHIHGYEFAPYGEGTLFDLMVAEVPARCMEIQADVFWVKHGGEDPVSFLRKHGKRVTSLHLKDMADDTEIPSFTGHAPEESSVPLGSGSIDIAGVLAEARRLNVRHYIIEDESPHVHEQIPQTFTYLATITR